MTQNILDMSTANIIKSIKESVPDYNNMRSWNGFFFDKEFDNLLDVHCTEVGERKQYFLDYKIFHDKYNIDLEAIGDVMQVLYPTIKFKNIPQVAYAECQKGWDLGPHTHDNEIALHMTVFLNKKENAGIYVHDKEENFFNDAVYVRNIYDNCCVFPFTGKEWHGVDVQNISETRKLLYIDWLK